MAWYELFACSTNCLAKRNFVRLIVQFKAWLLSSPLKNSDKRIIITSRCGNVWISNSHDDRLCFSDYISYVWASAAGVNRFVNYQYETEQEIETQERRLMEVFRTVYVSTNNIDNCVQPSLRACDFLKDSCIIWTSCLWELNVFEFLSLAS